MAPKFDRTLYLIAISGVIALSACGSPAASSASVASTAQAPSFGGSSTQRVDAWFADAGAAELASLSDAITGVGHATPAALGAACARLATAVASAQAGPPVPDAAAQSSLASALPQYARAAADCQAGAPSDTAVLNQANAAFRAAAADEEQFNAETEDAQTRQLRSQEASKCRQLYQAWQDGPARAVLSQFLTALGALPEINSQTNIPNAAAAAATAAQPAAQLTGFPVPACADPGGYLAAIIATVRSAAAGASAATSQSAEAQALVPLNGVPTLEAEFTDEVHTATGT